MERILDRLLLLARADQPDFLELTDVQLDAFLEDVFLRWSEVAPRTWQLGPIAHGIVRADPEQLRIALDALLENAVKYSDVHDEIELSATARGSRVAIEVRDTGIGIPREAASRIFDRFSRADAARTRAQGGVGLGLAIVDAIAKAHGGRARVRRLDRGSLFSLDLPGFAPVRVGDRSVAAAETS
jgi:signal transduction histidine kinase